MQFTQFYFYYSFWSNRYFRNNRKGQQSIPSVTFISWAMTIPLWITGSLYPTCVSDRPISLSVKHACTITLYLILHNWLVSDQYMHTFEGLWYYIRGYRPSQTDHLILFHTFYKISCILFIIFAFHKSR